MDAMLTFFVLIGIIALGMIISIGNERQRRALDEIRKQIEGWAAEDIRMKRAKAVGEIHVSDPKHWIASTASRIFGALVPVEDVSVWEHNNVKALVATSDGRTLVLTPVPPERFIPANQVDGKKHNRLTGPVVTILGKNPRKVPVYECSVLTHGAFFDLEARSLWQNLTGESLELDRMWLYDVPRQ